MCNPSFTFFTFWKSNGVSSRRALRRSPESVPSRPKNPLSQIYATGTAIMREMTYPQPFHISGGFSQYFSPPPLGRCLVLVAYWIMILAMLWSNVLLKPTSSMYAYKWEIVAFRAAWVSVTQLPLVYCLSCKINMISLISGLSYERLNWLHRWVARTLFLTVIVHWSFFFREWSLAKFVTMEISMMPMVRYGFGAWAVIGWMVLSSFGYLRAKCYEFFILQHIVSAVVLLWLVHKHVPAYAAYNVWLAIGFVVLDHAGRYCCTVYYNLHLLKSNQNRFTLGYAAYLQIVTHSSVRVSIKDVRFRWTPGQHVYISIPSLGFFQSHPFTIGNLPEAVHGNASVVSRSLELYIQAQSGFTRKLLRKAKQDCVVDEPLRAFISGPLGIPPSLETYETIVFIATSSGVSFNLPLFEAVINQGHCWHVYFYWIVREKEQLDWYYHRITSLTTSARINGVEVTVVFFVTGRNMLPRLLEAHQTAANHEDYRCLAISSSSSYEDETLGTLSKEEKFSTNFEQGACTERTFTASSLNNVCQIDYTRGRPSVGELLNRPVEHARGETAIVACGGAGFTADVRNHVAWLSDDRAVHKGSGAQGIFLFTETYGW